MTQFFLITGFLGSGKTTFLKSFLPRLKGKDIQLIINEFGNTGVDGSLLSDYGTTLQEICGGSIFCSCKLDRFEEALNDCLSTNPEIILVEASGLSDPTNIRKILENYQQQGKLHYQGCVCLVDCVRFHKVLNTARVCKKQLMVADIILLNKIDLVSINEIENLKNLIKQHAPIPPIYCTKYGEINFPIEKLEVITPPSLEELAHRPDITLQKLSLEIDESMSKYELEKFLQLFAEDTARIKGYVYLRTDGFLLVDSVGAMISVKPTNIQNQTLGLTLLATEGQPMRKSLKSAIDLYPDKAKIIKL